MLSDGSTSFKESTINPSSPKTVPSASSFLSEGGKLLPPALISMRTVADTQVTESDFSVRRFLQTERVLASWFSSAKAELGSQKGRAKKRQVRRIRMGPIQVRSQGRG